MNPNIPSGDHVAARVVVGVDGSEHARAAAAWAAQWAHANNAQLHLVMAERLPPRGRLLAPFVRNQLSAYLVTEIARVEATYPDLAMTAQVLIGSPAGALVAASESADLLVVGSRGRGGWASLLLGGVSAAVAAHADCPVVVVPRETDVDTLEGPVVLGADGSPESAVAARFAFEHASREGLEIIATHAWRPPATMGMAVGTLNPVSEDLETLTQPVWQDTVQAHAAAHPDVAVDCVVGQGHPAVVIAQAHPAPSLAVVGSRGRGGFAGQLLGSVSRDLLHCARCPVAVVRPAARSVAA